MPELSPGAPELISPFTRSIDFLGGERFAELQKSFVTVFGLGGVGSHALCSLARTGVGRLRMVDFDDISASSLNRSAVFTRADVGRPKTEVMKEHLARIAPETRADALAEFFDEDTADVLLDGPPDYVIDAIDSEGPKLRLLRTCVERGIRVVSCMGAAARSDPTQVRVADLSKTNICPLAHNIRKRLRREGITTGITCVFSLEHARPSLPPDPNEPTLERGRKRRRLPSLITIPAIFGLTAASVVIDRLPRAGTDTTAE
jgi:tRNA A37 threonylcarbamoyladenosine dehydratase